MNSFDNVTAHSVANIYFDGKVVSHKITLETGEDKTLGVIFVGEYSFDTEKAEKMEITAGRCLVAVAGAEEKSYTAGEYFDVPANSNFTIKVAGDNCQYICSYLAE